MSQNLNTVDTPFYKMDIPETETVIKEKSEWFKVDLPKKVVEYKKKPKWLRVKLPIGPKYTKTNPSSRETKHDTSVRNAQT